MTVAASLTVDKATPYASGDTVIITFVRPTTAVTFTGNAGTAPIQSAVIQIEVPTVVVADKMLSPSLVSDDGVTAVWNAKVP